MAVGDHEGCVMAAAEEVRNVPEYGYRHKTAVGESRDVDFEQASYRILNSRYKTKIKKNTPPPQKKTQKQEKMEE